MWFVQTCRVDVVDPSVGAFGRAQTIKQVQSCVAAALCWLDLNRNGTTHGIRPHVTTLNPVLNGVPIALAIGVWAQPATVSSFCLRCASDSEHGRHHDYCREHGDGTAIKPRAGRSKELHVSPNNFCYNVQVAIFMYFTSIA